MATSLGPGKRLQTDTITSQAAGTGILMQGRFNASWSGNGSGTIVLQRSFDGVTYQTISKDSAGADASFTAPCSLVVEEVESGVYYRWNVTTYSSGTFSTRLSQ